MDVSDVIFSWALMAFRYGATRRAAPSTLALSPSKGERSGQASRPPTGRPPTCVSLADRGRRLIKRNASHPSN